MNKKGFFISIDLIITLASVIFLFGILGVYLHSTIHNYSLYKNDAKMESTMNIALNRIALSDYSCDLVDSKGNSLHKKVAFCISDKNLQNIDNLFSDLDYKVSVFKVTNYSFPHNKKAKKYIAKDVFLLVPSKDLNKQEYFNCTQGVCDVNKLVRVYVWS